jgi:SAM-dependent methyltransferase
LGSETGRAHRGWYRLIAEHYSSFYAPGRDEKATAFLDRLFRRQGEVRDLLDVACGTFSIGLSLMRRGYRVVGRDLSEHMVRSARMSLRTHLTTADVRQADMRDLRLRQHFDAILCLGTAFNYLAEPTDAGRALRAFRRHLRSGGLLVLDLANFDAWIDDNPVNARAEVDVRARNGTRIAVFGFNEQRPGKAVHIARFLTVMQRGKNIDLRLDEAPLKVWRKEDLSRTLFREGFRPSEWWGDLEIGTRYVRRKSPRLVSVAVRT